MKIIIILRGVSRFLIIAVLVCGIFYLGGETGYQIKYRLEIWKTNRAMEKFNQSIIEMFEKDTYGGATPAETYNMFVSALKNEDVDLAVEYFVLDPDRRARHWKDFDEMRQRGTLQKYIEGWPEWENWEQDKKDKRNDWEGRAEIYYSEYIDESFVVYDPLLKKDTIVQPGRYIQEDIVFIKNSNNIWKIETL